MPFSRTAKGVVCILISNVIFGFSYLFTKTVTARISPLALLGWRFAAAAAVMGLLAALGAVKLRPGLLRRHSGPLLGMTLLAPVLYFAAENYGIRLTSTGESSAIIATIPIVTLVLGSLLLGERPTAAQTAGIVTTVLGVLLVVLAKGLCASFSLPGYLLLAAAVLSYSLFAVVSQRLRQYTDAEKTFAMLVSGAAVFFAAALAESAAHGTAAEFLTLPLHDGAFLAAVLYLGVGSSVAAFFCYNTAISALGAARTASFTGVSTVVSVGAGIALLGESFSVLQGAGTALILAGVYAANFWHPRRPGRTAV